MHQKRRLGRRRSRRGYLLAEVATIQGGLRAIRRQQFRLSLLWLDWQFDVFVRLISSLFQ